MPAVPLITSFLTFPMHAKDWHLLSFVASIIAIAAHKIKTGLKGTSELRGAFLWLISTRVMGKSSIIQ